MCLFIPKSLKTKEALASSALTNHIACFLTVLQQMSDRWESLSPAQRAENQQTLQRDRLREQRQQLTHPCMTHRHCRFEGRRESGSTSISLACEFPSTLLFFLICRRARQVIAVANLGDSRRAIQGWLYTRSLEKFLHLTQKIPISLSGAKVGAS